MKELQKHAPEGGGGGGHGHGHGHGHDEGVDYNRKKDSYLEILANQKTLHLDLEVLQTLARPGDAEKLKKQKEK